MKTPSKQYLMNLSNMLRLIQVSIELKIIEYKQNPRQIEMIILNLKAVGTRVSKKLRKKMIKLLINRKMQICLKRKNNRQSKNKQSKKVKLQKIHFFKTQNRIHLLLMKMILLRKGKAKKTQIKQTRRNKIPRQDNKKEIMKNQNRYKKNYFLQAVIIVKITVVHPKMKIEINSLLKNK